MSALTINEAAEIVTIAKSDPYHSENYGLYGYVDICGYNGILGAIQYMLGILCNSLNHRDLSDSQKNSLRHEIDCLDDYYNTVIEYCEENDVMCAEDIDCTTMCDVLANF